MSFINGALTVGSLQTNAPGNLSGIFCDGVEISVPVPSDWNATTGEAVVLNKPLSLSKFTNDLTGVLGNFNIPGNLTVGGSGTVSGSGSSVAQVNSDWMLQPVLLRY